MEHIKLYVCRMQEDKRNKLLLYVCHIIQLNNILVAIYGIYVSYSAYDTVIKYENYRLQLSQDISIPINEIQGYLYQQIATNVPWTLMFPIGNIIAIAIVLCIIYKHFTALLYSSSED